MSLSNSILYASRLSLTPSQHCDTIINYFNDRLTNASAESFNAKIKDLRRQFRGINDTAFFLFRLSALYG
jgi:transposase